MKDINTWPGWECVRQLGAGSFGKVYEIQREERGKIYKAALKVMTIPFSQSEIREAYSEGMTEQNVTEYFQEFVESITEEFALMSEFKGQSNIVSYEDHMVLKHEEGIGWDILIRMELLTPLPEWYDRHPLNEADVIALGCDVCRALELCWQKRIVHRDIKPENMFVNEYGDYKLGDFGIARTVEKTMATLSQKGTYTYIAPEVYKGQEYGQTADIYSLGLVLYRYLNERRMPFMPMDGTIRYSDRDESFKRRICGEQIPPPANGSQALKEVILKSVAYAPEERYRSAHEFREALKGCKSEIDRTTYLFPPRERKEQKEPPRRTEIVQNLPKPVEEPPKSVDKDKKKQMFTIGLYGIIGLLAGIFVIVMAGRGTRQDGLSELQEIPEERTAAEPTETEQPESIMQTAAETATVEEQTVTEQEMEETESYSYDIENLKTQEVLEFASVELIDGTNCIIVSDINTGLYGLYDGDSLVFDLLYNNIYCQGDGTIIAIRGAEVDTYMPVMSRKQQIESYEEKSKESNTGVGMSSDAAERKTSIIENIGSLNVRENPSTMSNRVGRVAGGTQVDVIDEAVGLDGNIWYQISYLYNGEIITGFVRSDFVSCQDTDRIEKEKGDSENDTNNKDVVSGNVYYSCSLMIQAPEDYIGGIAIVTLMTADESQELWSSQNVTSFPVSINLNNFTSPSAYGSVLITYLKNMEEIVTDADGNQTIQVSPQATVIRQNVQFTRN